MKIFRNNDIPQDQWNELLQLNSYGSPFQSPVFFSLYNNTSGYCAEAIAISENNALCALVVVTLQKEKGIKSLFSQRGIVYGGPIFKTDQDYIKIIEQIEIIFRHKCIYVEIRNFFDFHAHGATMGLRGWSFLPYLNFTIDLSSQTLDSIVSNMQYNRRREIKLSQGNDATFQECENEEQLGELYAMLRELYVQRVKLPLPSYSFFKNLWYSPIGKVFIVMHQCKIIGGSFCVYTKNMGVYTMYYCGLRNYHKKIYPTHLAVIAAIDFGIKNDLKCLDFMGAGIESEEYGVRKYKQEFGGTMNKFGRYRIVFRPLVFKLGELYIKLKKRSVK